MLPTRLNLLPRKKKKILEQVIFLHFIKGILELAIIIAATTSIALVGGARVLQDHYNALKQVTLASTSKYDAVDEQMSRLNKKISRAEKIQRRHIMWTPILAQFSSVLPEEVALQSLTLDAREKKVNLSGFADTRETLLEIQQAINEHPMLGPADIPASSLTAKEKIPFLISTTLDI